MVVLPADHWIQQPLSFLALLPHAETLAEQEALVALGIIPDRPETGYGYLQRGKRVRFGSPRRRNEQEAYHVSRFVEKPSLSKAQEYIATGEYYWNAGIFVWRAATILAEIATHLPQLRRGLDALTPHLHQAEYDAILSEIYHRLDIVSIDHGVLEKSSRLFVLPADIGWSDLGEWTTIHRLSPKDERGNARSGAALDIDSVNTFVHGNVRVVATIGLQNTIVIDTEDALLICAQDRAQDVKDVVRQLQARGAPVTHTSRTTNRPWGAYTVLEEGPSFKVKRIIVNPGAALSLQLHRHRSEHWVVISGIAYVTNGEQRFTLEASQSTYVPAGAKHRLANPGPDALEVIEVSTGSYLGEDDIVRFDDLYRRVSS
jgi:mannose-1-phosphate guanylyltransferase/mannose-6-phosphate isomerase